MFNIKHFFNTINTLLLVAFLLSSLIKNDTISLIINWGFLFTLLIDSIFQFHNRKQIKQGEVIQLDNLLTPLTQKLRKLFLLISFGTLVYYIIQNNWQDDLLSSSLNIIFPIYFALFFKDLISVKISENHIEFFSPTQGVLLLKNIHKIQFIRGVFLVQTNKKQIQIKGQNPNGFLQLQEFLLNNNIKHIKLEY